MIIVIVITVEMLLLIFSVNHEKDIAIPFLADLSFNKAFHVSGYSVILCFKTFRHSTDPAFHCSTVPPFYHFAEWVMSSCCTQGIVISHFVRFANLAALLATPFKEKSFL